MIFSTFSLPARFVGNSGHCSLVAWATCSAAMSATADAAIVPFLKCVAYFESCEVKGGGIREGSDGICLPSIEGKMAFIKWE